MSGTGGKDTYYSTGTAMIRVCYSKGKICISFLLSFVTFFFTGHQVHRTALTIILNSEQASIIDI